MLRLLDVVQRQRSEHRKIQRLILDTSGHGQADYALHLNGGMQELPPLRVRYNEELIYEKNIKNDASCLL